MENFCVVLRCNILRFQNHANLGPGQYEIKSSFDEWNTQHKARHGKFSKLQQYADRTVDGTHLGSAKDSVSDVLQVCSVMLENFPQKCSQNL